MPGTTWNPADKTASVTLSGSNLIATNANVVNQGVRAVDKQTSGKFYWEITFTTAATAYGSGCANSSAVLTSLYATPTNAVIVYASGAVYVNNVSVLALGSLGAGGVKICIALDLSANLFWVRNGAAGQWNASGTANPATGVGGQSVSGISGGGLYPAACFNANYSVTANFGDSAFVGVVPAGFTSGFPGAGGAAGTTQARAIVLA